MSATITTYEKNNTVDCIEVEIRDTNGKTTDTKILTPSEFDRFVDSDIFQSVQHVNYEFETV